MGDRQRNEAFLREKRDMVQTSRAMCHMGRLEKLRSNRECVETWHDEKRRWREQRKEAQIAEEARVEIMMADVRASRKGAKDQVENTKKMRTEATQAHMRDVIAENRRIVQQKTKLIGQYVDIERGLVDYVQESEGRQQQAEEDLHDFIVTAPSSRVDRLVCSLSCGGHGKTVPTGRSLD